MIRTALIVPIMTAVSELFFIENEKLKKKAIDKSVYLYYCIKRIIPKRRGKSRL